MEQLITLTEILWIIAISLILTTIAFLIARRIPAKEWEKHRTQASKKAIACDHEFYQDKQITTLRCEKCGLKGRYMGIKDLYPTQW